MNERELPKINRDPKERRHSCRRQLVLEGDKNTLRNKTHLTITYPFHPLCGHTVTVLQKMPRCGVDGWYVLTEDGHTVRIAHWMTMPRWKLPCLTPSPLISTKALLCLHRRLASVAFPSPHGNDSSSHSA